MSDKCVKYRHEGGCLCLHGVSDLKFIQQNFNPTLIQWVMGNGHHRAHFIDEEVSLSMLPPGTKTMVCSPDQGESFLRAGLKKLCGDHKIESPYK